MSSRREGILLHEALRFFEEIVMRCKRHGVTEQEAERVALLNTQKWVDARLRGLYSHASNFDTPIEWEPKESTHGDEVS